MSKHIAFLSVAAAVLGAAALPGGASAADYDGGVDRPLAFHSQDDVYLDGGRTRIERRQDLRPAYGDRRAPGPVAFDERDPDRRYDRPVYRYGEPGDRRPLDRPGHGYGRPAAFVPHVDRPYGGEADYGDGDGFRPAPLYRPAAAAVGPAFGGGYGDPDVGCTIEQAESTTPAGWRKIVTHRTCYRR